MLVIELSFGSVNILLIYSVWLESFAYIPQLLYLTYIDYLTNKYITLNIVFLALYKSFYLLNLTIL
jgi:hypothetical protein